MYLNSPPSNKRKLDGSESAPKRLAVETDKYLRAGDNYAQAQQYKETITQYSAALKLDAHLAIAYLKRSKAYWGLNKNREAKQDCLHAIFLEASHAALPEWLSVLIPADFQVETLLDEQLGLFKILLVDEAQTNSDFMRLARTILFRQALPQDMLPEYSR